MKKLKRANLAELAKSKTIISFLEQSTTMEEKLLITLTHEAMHANHMARYQEAMRKGEGKYSNAAKFLLKKGYSQEFVNIYFKKENGEWHKTTPEYREEKLHDYMKTHNQGVIDAALDEYRNEHK